MQLISMGVYSRTGARRDVVFTPGALNILTGKSKTGKSAILDVVEFCLGRNTVTIPSGVISDQASWYYVLVSFDEHRVFIGRPNPETATTGHAMVRTGGSDLQPLEFVELEVNADTDVVRDTLTSRLGIERYLVEPEPGSLRASFEVSVRQALFFSFQSQGEIANRDVLFHRATDSSIKTTIRDTLPYFLGAATPKQFAVRRQLVNARRVLQRLQNDIRAVEQDLDDQAPRIMRLLSTAASLGVPLAADSLASVRSQLEAIAEFEPPVADTDPELAHQHGEHARAIDALTERVREVDARADTLRSLLHARHRAAGEAGFQVDRLSAVDLMIPVGTGEGNLSTCPLCAQNLPEPDESVEAIRAQLTRLRANLASSSESDRVRESAIESLEAKKLQLRAEIRRELVELDTIRAQSESIADGASLRERIAQLKGRVLQELERGVDTHQDVASLKERERAVRGQIARLEELEAADSPRAALQEALDAISGSMTRYAEQLGLEGSEHQIVLDPTELSVAAIYPGGRRPLARMGSAENWVGYHLVAHLALHEWFVNHGRPVPRFLMLDQPTQAFFPEEIVDAAEDEDADWEAVRRQFVLLRDVVSNLNGGLQIIVCDHANLSEQWFQDAIVDNWRNGIAFIPTGWLED
ncbi:DUF3732 domain-containing protein [Microbacterium sp. Sa4CUA7]|uniref:DUF3732 domain-containing protein n=1 Tax=Microbacterium pullorum TaxID=2762236 RepID=A0ABR8S586_9MICO|nr:DUF3732 domain-containing protein [Microbacterium pullorum]MBD7958643.1 DUF3732 domain-containing protein [Microbacterium pullorum]